MKKGVVGRFGCKGIQTLLPQTLMLFLLRVICDAAEWIGSNRKNIFWAQELLTTVGWID